MTVLSLFLLALAASTSASAFNLRSYDQHFRTAACPTPSHSANTTLTLDLHYADLNPGARKTLLLVHGWPSLWASWKFQIAAFENDYRLIVPDLRGYGASSAPPDVRADTTMPDLTNDLACVLQHAGVKEPVVCIGHDWGTQTCFETARQHGAALVAGVVGITIPYMPYAGPYVPMAALVPQLPHLAYQVYFDTHTAEATRELDQDVRRTLRATLRTVASPPPEGFLLSNESYLGAWKDVREIAPIPFLSDEEEDYWVERYGVQGFGPTLYFYQSPSRYASWLAAQSQGGFIIEQPAFSILDTQDPVANWPAAAELLKSAEFIPNGETKTIGGAHWVHLELPEQVNGMIREWLGVHYPADDAPASESAAPTEPTSEPIETHEATPAPTAAPVDAVVITSDATPKTPTSGAAVETTTLPAKHEEL